jgi:hypothetical protein
MLLRPAEPRVLYAWLQEAFVGFSKVSFHPTLVEESSFLYIIFLVICKTENFYKMSFRC